MKLIIYGVGKKLSGVIDRLKIDDILCFADKNYKEYENGIYGKIVIGPGDIYLYNYELILVTSDKFFEEISVELVLKHAIPINRIMSAGYFIGDYPRAYIAKTMSQIYNGVLRYSQKKYDFPIAQKYYVSYLEDKLKSLGVEILSNDELNEAYYKDRTITVIKGLPWRMEIPDDILQIYVVSHRDYAELNDSNYHTLWVGNKFSENKFFSKLNNINEYNPLINECTALYSIWKHDKKSDYIGLNHYRRFFRSVINQGLPIQKWEALLIMKQCDVIVAPANIYSVSIKEQLAENLNVEAYNAGVNALYKVFGKKSEKEKQILHQFMEENVMYPYGMFIMRRELVDEYCKWLFPILFEMIDHVTIKEEWDAYSKRIIGFIAERLFTVWLLLTEYRIEELPVILTDDTGPYGLGISKK